VNTVQEPVRRIVIDEAKSHFCDGNFMDGVWTRRDANCNDEIHMKAVASRSEYITVRVEPVSATAGLASSDKSVARSFGDQ